MSSEQLLGITEPADYQCDAIDNMIDQSVQAADFCRNAMTALDSQTIVQANKEVLHRIESFAGQLEEFRSAIEQTRQWGDEWKKLAKSLRETYVIPEIRFDDDIPF